MGPRRPRGHPVGASISQEQNSFYGEERRSDLAGLALHCKVLPKREGTSHALPSRAHSARLSPSLAFAARPPHDAEKWASAESITRTSTRVLLRVVSRQPQEDNLTLQANSVSSRFLSRAQTRAKHTRAPPEGVQGDVCLPYRGGLQILLSSSRILLTITILGVASESRAHR